MFLMADSQPKLEVWLRGPLPDIPGTLQPIAHALLQALEELESLLSDFPESLSVERFKPDRQVFLDR